MDTTLMKGLRLLERLVKSDTPLGVSELAAELDLHKSNVHRTLTTLGEMGYVERSASGRYRASRRIWELGTKVIARDPVRRAALALMHSLHEETSETVSLAVLDDGDCLYLHQITAPMPIRPMSAVGQRVPAVFPASGKAMLAFQQDSEKLTRELCARKKRFGPRKVSLNGLLQDLATIRRTGYAFSMGSWHEGVHSVAGVVFGQDQHAVGAIAVSGPAERFPRERMKTLAKSVLNACTQVGNALGA